MLCKNCGQPVIYTDKGWKHDEGNDDLFFACLNDTQTFAEPAEEA